MRAVRKIVRIDEDKCNGCGLCVPGCAEGAIRIINGKARLMAENLCDGLGNCLGECPRGAITIEERAADAFDAEAVERHLAPPLPSSTPHHGGCPGSRLMMLHSQPRPPAEPTPDSPGSSARLGHWPIQLTLLPERGPLWDGADVVLAADCVAFAWPQFARRSIAGKTLAIACPKLDDGAAYVDKLARIFAANTIRSLTIVHMEVPCCFGLERIARMALTQAGVQVPLATMEISIKGEVLSTNPA